MSDEDAAAAFAIILLKDGPVGIGNGRISFGVKLGQALKVLMMAVFDFIEGHVEEAHLREIDIGPETEVFAVLVDAAMSLGEHGALSGVVGLERVLQLGVGHGLLVLLLHLGEGVVSGYEDGAGSAGDIGQAEVVDGSFGRAKGLYLGALVLDDGVLPCRA